MKTVKHYKSFPIQGISGAISSDVQEVIEAKYQREVIRVSKTYPEGERLPFSEYAKCRSIAHSKALGELQTLLTSAIMELKHKDLTEAELKTQMKIS